MSEWLPSSVASSFGIQLFQSGCRDVPAISYRVRCDGTELAGFSPSVSWFLLQLHIPLGVDGPLRVLHSWSTESLHRSQELIGSPGL